MSDLAPDRNPETHVPPRRMRWLALSPWVFWAAAIPLIVVNLRRGRGQFDQEVFHGKVIAQFAHDWPRVDLSDYLSATTPGYHLVMAAVWKLGLDSLLALKVVGSLFTVALLWLLEDAVRRRLIAGERDADVKTPRWLPLALVAPVVGSMYVFIPGVWLQPDNAGWLGVLVMLLIALRERFDRVSLIVSGLTLVALVWVRQSHVWAAGLLWVAAWLGSGPGVAPIILVTGERAKRVTIALAVSLPAIASLGYFYKLWGGLTPPYFHKQHAAGFNLATPAFALALMAIFSHFFLAWMAPGLMVLGRSWRGRVLMGGAIATGLLLAVIPETTFVYEARSTGLWNVVKALDQRGVVLKGRTSPVMLALAPLGALCVVAWMAQLVSARRVRDAWILGLGLAGFVAAQTANTNAWQRYLEPMLLMVMALMAAMLPRPAVRWAWAGPALLGLLLAALTAYTLWREPIFVMTW